MNPSTKKAEVLSWAGLVFSILFFIISFLLSGWSGVFAIYALSWQFLGAVIIWLALGLGFHQQGLAEQEKLDLASLAKDEDNARIFEQGEERAMLFSAAQKRLEIFEKWFLPIWSGTLNGFRKYTPISFGTPAGTRLGCIGKEKTG